MHKHVEFLHIIIDDSAYQALQDYDPSCEEMSSHLLSRMRDVCPPAQGRSAERDGVLVEALRQGRHRQVVDARTSGAHTKYGDVIRVAPEALDVVLDPSSQKPDLLRLGG